MERAAGPIWPFVRTASQAVEQALDLAEVGPSDLLVDAGCGDGQVCIAAARRGARSIGWDLDEHLVQESRRKAKLQGVDATCSFEHRDAIGIASKSGKGPALYQPEPDGPAHWLPPGTTVLFLFATDEVLDELRTRLETVVRQGVRVLTYNYSAAWLPEQASIRRGAVRLYATPALHVKQGQKINADAGYPSRKHEAGDLPFNGQLLEMD